MIPRYLLLTATKLHLMHSSFRLNLSSIYRLAVTCRTTWQQVWTCCSSMKPCHSTRWESWRLHCPLMTTFSIKKVRYWHNWGLFKQMMRWEIFWERFHTSTAICRTTFTYRANVQQFVSGLTVRIFLNKGCYHHCFKLYLLYSFLVTIPLILFWWA